jgi:hypothetical protein
MPGVWHTRRGGITSVPERAGLRRPLLVGQLPDQPPPTPQRSPGERWGMRGDPVADRRPIQPACARTATLTGWMLHEPTQDGVGDGLADDHRTKVGAACHQPGCSTRQSPSAASCDTRRAVALERARDGPGTCPCHDTSERWASYYMRCPSGTRPAERLPRTTTSVSAGHGVVVGLAGLEPGASS